MIGCRRVQFYCTINYFLLYCDVCRWSRRTMGRRIKKHAVKNVHDTSTKDFAEVRSIIARVNIMNLTAPNQTQYNNWSYNIFTYVFGSSKTYYLRK